MIQFRRNFPLLACLTLAISSVIGGGYLAQDSATDAAESAGEPFWEKTSLQWLEPVESERVVVENRYGNVYVRFGGYEPKLEVLATVQRLDPDRPALEVDRTAAEEAFRVTVRDPAAPDDPRKRGRIDLVLFVPINLVVDVTTVHDLIEVKGLKGDVTLRTETGDIRTRKVQGTVNATSERGSIALTLEADVTDRPQAVTTRTGEIEIYVWEDSNFDVTIATSGEISTDFSIDIEHLRFEEPNKKAIAKIGEEGTQLSIASKQGAVHLRRMQRFFTPESEDRR